MSAQNAYAEFHTYSIGVARRFLQSVVVVDDKAETNPETKPAAPEISPAANLIHPGRTGRKLPIAKKEETTDSTNKEVVNEQKKEVSALPSPQPKDAEVLPIKALNEAFAGYGIVCGFLSPSITGSDRARIVDAVEKTAKRADVVILDWRMEIEAEGQPFGYTALKIIDHILKSDEDGNDSFQSSGRLRLIVIYSQTSVLTDITDAIQRHLNVEITPNHNFKRLDEYTLSHESTRICVFRKSGGTTNDDRTYDVNKLTDKIIDEFTLLTEGLLSNVAIEALSALRQNTHKILQKFNPSLDAPYLTHRALSSPPEETQSHPIALLASEMQDVLEGHGIINSVSPELIKIWIQSIPERSKPQSITVHSTFKNTTVEQQLDFVADAVVNGVEEATTLSNDNQASTSFINKLKSSKKDDKSTFTNLMLADDTGTDKDREFSMLTTIRSHYTTPPPYLNLGTVIATRNGDISNYYVCVQPVCDCVRIDNIRKFPFLKLELKPNKFDIVIKDNGKFLELKVNYKLYNMEVMSFSPQGGLIKAKSVDDSWIFEGINGADELIQCFWIADLKFAHAQRIAEQFGGQSSRVGLTESEWLRRMAS